jgi:hypothetical protein
VPECLCFEQNFDVTVAFIADLGRRLCANAVSAKGQHKPRKRRLDNWYDFAKLKYISPGAGLAIAAEFDRARILSGWFTMFTVNMDDWDPQVRSTLLELGLLPLLGIDRLEEQAEGANLVVPFRSDNFVNMSVASDTLKAVIELAVSAALLDDVGQDRLHTFRTFLQAIGEALTNTSDHAYPENRQTDLPHVGRWWITGSVNRDSKRLTFAVYDQGVTIPLSIPNGRSFGKMTRFFRRLTGAVYDPNNPAMDGMTIAAAVRSGVSGTGLDFRGHGLALMRNYIKRERSGRLRIISRNGDFIACSGQKDQYRAMDAALPGTFIEWTVDL